MPPILAFATFGNVTQTGSFLLVLRHPGWQKQEEVAYFDKTKTWPMYSLLFLL